MIGHAESLGILREQRDAVKRERDELLQLVDEALNGLREPMTLADARRVRDTLTHHHVQRMLSEVRP